MKRLALAALAAMVIGNSTGCCLIDRIFHCNSGCGGCGTMCDGCAGGCGGGCSSCEGGGCGSGGCAQCDGCAQMGGHPPVTYGQGSALTSRVGQRFMGGGGDDGCSACEGCGGRGCGMCGGCGVCRKDRGCYQQEGDANQNYPGAYVGYPYYTLRGPRDFLACNPGGLSR